MSECPICGDRFPHQEMDCLRRGLEREKSTADALAKQCAELERDRDRNAELWAEQKARAEDATRCRCPDVGQAIDCPAHVREEAIRLRDSLAAAEQQLSEARALALREAAELCDAAGKAWRKEWMTASWGAEELAERIRALAAQPHPLPVNEITQKEHNEK